MTVNAAANKKLEVDRIIEKIIEITGTDDKTARDLHSGFENLRCSEDKIIEKAVDHFFSSSHSFNH